MNMHVPRSIQTVVELKLLPAVPKQIISPSSNSPIIKPSQDNLLGVYKITDDDVFLSYRDVMNLMYGVSVFNGELPKPEIDKGNYKRWTGKQIVSLLLPDITIITDKTKIIKGVIESGQIDKGISNRIVHIIFKDFGYKIAADYMNNLQKVISKYMVRSGFSVGISDLIVDKSIRDKNEDKIIEAKENVIDMTRQVHLNVFENVSKGIGELYEAKIQKKLGELANDINESTVKVLKKDNRVNYIVSSGSKGNATNISQMSSLLGQQMVDGKRIALGFSNRSLPHFQKYDNGIESKGFIVNNFKDGLKPYEFFFHAMAGREGLIDTAVKTAKSGYIQRRLIKATEDLKTTHDYTVRNSNDSIVQFIYGEDGFNSIYIEKQTFDYILLITKQIMMDRILLFSPSDFNWQLYMTKSAYDKMSKNSLMTKIFSAYNKRAYELIDIAHECYKLYIPFNEKKNDNKVKNLNDFLDLYFPINFKRLLSDVKNMFHLTGKNKSNIDPLYIIGEYENMFDYCVVNGTRSVLLEMLVLDKLSPLYLIKEIRITKIAFDSLVNSIKLKFMRSLVQGGEMVGPITAQSIGEISTQLTLNSVEWNTELLLEVDGALEKVKIGEWIDKRLESADDKNVEKHPNDTTLEYVKDKKIRIMAPTEDGKIIWDNVSAVTKHPVVNKDGSDTLIKVTLDSGREVTATKGKSFLMRVDNKIEQVDGDTLKVGDYIPVSTVVLEPEKTLNEWDYSNHIPKTEYVYMSEIRKAYSQYEKIYVNLKQRRWFKGNDNFTIPYKRSDIFIEAYKSQFSLDKDNEVCRRKSDKVYKDNCVYPIPSGKFHSGHLPEKIKLDALFGFFVGAYLAEGHSTKYQVLISNNDDDYLDKIKEFVDKHGLKYHIDDQMKNGGRSRTLRIHSYVLAQLFIKSMGKTSDLKRVPGELLAGNEEFLKALVDGYISGDGTITKKNSVKADSISQGLLYDIQHILTKYKIFSKIKPMENALKYNLERGLNARLSYNMSLSVVDSYKFRQHFKLTVKNKQERLDNFKKPKTNYSLTDMIPNIKTKQLGTITIKRNTLDKYIDDCEVDENYEDLEIFKSIKEENIYYDKIVSIEDVENKNKYVYDLTADTTKNFITHSNILLKDTFHYAGVGEKSNVNQGVPRLEEILNNTPNIKQPQINIYLTEDYRYDIKKVEEAKYNLELVRIGDLLNSDAIYFEPSNEIEGILEEDAEIMKIYEVFSELDSQYKNIPDNPWLIRLEFNHQEMIEKHITMNEINLILKQQMPGAVIIFADDNSGKLIFRIRIDFDVNKDNADDDITFLKNKIDEIKAIIIKGLNSINKIYRPKECDSVIIKEGDYYINKTEYVLETSGGNLFEILIKPYVDSSRTTSINVNDIYAIFGIEAARWALEYQLNDVIAKSNSSVSPRNLGLLCDAVTHRGKIMSVDRNGINRSDNDIGPLAKSSFEETTEQLKLAGIYGSHDNISGVSSNIMVGQIPKCGTGDSEVILDEEMLKEIGIITQNETEKFNKHDILETLEEEDEYCAENMSIGFNINNIEADNINLESLPV